MKPELDTSASARSPLYRRAAESLRRRIVAGEFAPGEKLPTVRVLARENDIPVPTMGRAVRYLSEIGVLYNRPPVGTFVRAHGGEFRRVGIYLTRTPAKPDMRFYAELVAHLLQQFSTEGVEARVFYDDRGEQENQTTPWPPLAEAVRNGEIEALAVPLANKCVLNWSYKLGVPAACCGAAKIAGYEAIGWNFTPWCEALAEEFRRRGMRRVGLLSSVPDGINWVGLPQFTRQFLTCMEAHRIDCPPEWRLVPDAEFPYAGGHVEWGHRNGLRFLKFPDRPDALVVFPDIVAVGVISGILESGADALGKTRLFVHCHPDSPIYLPVPCTVFGDSIAENARALIAALHRAAVGEPPARNDNDCFIRDVVPQPVEYQETMAK